MSLANSLAVKRTWRNRRMRAIRLKSIRETARSTATREKKSVSIRLVRAAHPELWKNCHGRPKGTPQSAETRRRIGIGSKLAWENKESAGRRAAKVSTTNKRLYQEGKIILPGPNAWHRQIYKKILMRSSWEVAFAKWCDRNEIRWVYEPQRFSIPSGAYTPDFYLPKYDFWVEVKGAMMFDPLKRYFEFRKKYPEKRIALLDRELLKETNILR